MCTHQPGSTRERDGRCAPQGGHRYDFVESDPPSQPDAAPGRRTRLNSADVSYTHRVRRRERPSLGASDLLCVVVYVGASLSLAFCLGWACRGAVGVCP